MQTPQFINFQRHGKAVARLVNSPFSLSGASGVRRDRIRPKLSIKFRPVKVRSTKEKYNSFGISETSFPCSPLGSARQRVFVKGFTHPQTGGRREEPKQRNSTVSGARVLGSGSWGDLRRSCVKFSTANNAVPFVKVIRSVSNYCDGTGDVTGLFL